MLVRVRALIFFLFFGLGSQCLSVPFAFTYAGRLLDGSGNPLSGSQSVQITFWTAQTGGSQLAANLQSGTTNDTYTVNVVNGVFSQVINLSAANFHTVFPDSTTGTWVQVEAAGITYPRQQFTAVPYALKVPVDGSTITYNSSGQLQVSSIGSVANINASSTLSTTSSGSASAPALFFGGDTNTGIYSSGTDSLSVTTGGAERLRINSLGDAKFGPYLHFCKGGSNTSQITWNCSQTGTGATDNIYTPDWAGSVDASMLVMKQRAGGTGSLDIYGKKHGTTSTPAALSTFSHIASFDADNARVGMGTLSPSSKLEVVGTTSGVISAVQSGSTNSQIISAQFSGGNVGSTSATAALMRVTSNSNYRPLASFNDKSIFDAAGNLGVGTAVPATQLHVVGASNAAYSNIFVQDTTAMASQVGGGIVFGGKYHTDGSYARYGQIRGIKENGTSGNYLSALSFSTNDQTTLGEKMRITSSGNVGIGTTAPAAKLDVAGEVRLGNTSATCGTTTEGSIRYNSTLKLMEFCNGTSWSVIIQESIDRATNGGRLTVVSGSTDIPNTTGASNLYFTPAISNQISLYDGTNWRIYVFSEFSLALSGLTSGKNYDVFVYVNNGSPALELGPAWTNNTTRATTLTLTGVYTKTGDMTRRYVGTIRATAATTTEDSQTKRFVWNFYNQRPSTFFRYLLKTNWAYTTSAWRNFNNDNTVRLEYVSGLSQTLIFTVASNLQHSAVGINLDGSGSSSGTLFTQVQNGGTENYIVVGRSKDVTTVGYHYVQGVEYGFGTAARQADIEMAGQFLN